MVCMVVSSLDACRSDSGDRKNFPLGDDLEPDVDIGALEVPSVSCLDFCEIENGSWPRMYPGTEKTKIWAVDTKH